MLTILAWFVLGFCIGWAWYAAKQERKHPERYYRGTYWDIEEEEEHPL